MKNHPVLALTLALAAALPLPALASDVQLGIDPASGTVLAGGSTLVDVVASYGGTDKLLGGAFSLSFDATLLELVHVTLKAPSEISGTLGTLQTVGNVSTLTGVGFSSFNGIGGTFDFATLEFKALGTSGISPLSVFDAQDLIYSWASESLEPVTVQSGLGSMTVAAVPEPASLVLLLAGFGVVAAATRRGQR